MHIPDISDRQHRLFCRLAGAPGDLERLLQVVRRRGFSIRQVEARQTESCLAVALHVQGARAIETLRAHLANIATMQSVQRPLGPVDVSCESAPSAVLRQDEASQA
ncbi:ACT domain-containing protein [Salinisphaera sp. Q1T1-3]|uniref:ACT domain-containing protein n=1 Tax=Salinisphaera sp. Q1T1-3 TaxID=2321229 RepID=UPI000E711C9B|nr:ACT domain-containing protein [Salinisphaera sp. Q1T1-3]RJS93061.1 hypothetical protein D3260_09175 [Salinisphaera sp. Q1T1-3]